jgi:putative hydrolase of the HAD superfamily
MSVGIKAILIDSGKVLNRPKTGHWFITPNFFSFINMNKFKSIPMAELSKAFSKAGDYIDKQDFILDEEEEYKHFYEYYKLLFENLPELNVDSHIIESVTRDLVFNYEKYEFYEDVEEFVIHMSKKCKLAIVSDAWPSLENVYRTAGLRNMFHSFIISSKLGVTKPNELMYKKALEELGVSASEAVFIDDSVKNCDGASKLGINTILLCRNNEEFLKLELLGCAHKVVKSLRDIEIELF